MSEGERPALALLKEPGGVVWVAEAPNWIGSGSPLKIGISQDAMKGQIGRGLRHMVGQLYGVIGPGLIMAQHVFQGLKRDMYVRNDSRADVKKLAITWAHPGDAVFLGDQFAGELEYGLAPKDRVFAVYVSPNEMLDTFPSIHGWAEHWTWIAADRNTPGAPINWDTRFERRIWTNARDLGQTTTDREKPWQRG
jgi:hypothetical protein